MAAGTYQPIVPWDVEAFRSGALPQQESASLAAKRGAPAALDSSSQLVEAGTSFSRAAFILAKDGSNGTAGTSIMAYKIHPSFLWEVTLSEAFAISQIGKQYGLVKDGTTGNWYLSTADIGNQMTIVAQHPATAVGDTKSRVIAAFNPNAIQAYGANQPNVIVMSADGAITPQNEGTYVLTKAGVLAATLAAPTSGTDDGKKITITSSTANAHTVTFGAGVLKNGGAAATIFTFTGTTSGGALNLIAYGGKWNVVASVGGAFS